MPEATAGTRHDDQECAATAALLMQQTNHSTEHS